MPKSNPHWNNLGSDLLELILSRLPITSILCAASVCKQWNSIIHHSTSFKIPWFILTVSVGKHIQVFGFNPLSNRWIQFPEIPRLDTFVASDGFFIITNLGKFIFREAFGGKIWCKTVPNLTFPRFNAQIGIYYEPDCSKSARFIVAGGNTQGISSWPWDIVYNLEVEIYNPDRNVWEICSPLPENFRLGNGSSAKPLCSTVHKGKFYVLNVDSGFLSSFDFKTGCWSTVHTLKPPGLQTLFTYLVSCEDRLILVGFFFSPLNYDPEFSLWKVNEETLNLNLIGIMPRELASILLGVDLNRRGITTEAVSWSSTMIRPNKVICRGSGNLVYVMHARTMQTFVCDIADPGKCTWRKIPELLPMGRDSSCFQAYNCYSFKVSIQDTVMAQKSFRLGNCAGPMTRARATNIKNGSSKPQ